MTRALLAKFWIFFGIVALNRSVWRWDWNKQKQILLFNRNIYELQLCPQKQWAFKMTDTSHHLEVGKNSSDIFLKSHVNHAISFIKNQIPRWSANKRHYYMTTIAWFDWLLSGLDFLITLMGTTKLLLCLCPAILVSAGNKTHSETFSFNNCCI